MSYILVFDFDGTLVDSMEHLAKIASRILTSYYGLSTEISRDLYFKTSGLPFEEQIELMFPNHKSNKEAVAHFEREKENTIFKQPLFLEVKNIFSAMSAAGHKLVVSSSNIQSILVDYFLRADLKIDLILGYKKGFSKGKAHFDYIKKYFRVRDDKSVFFIGDSLKDYQRAKDNGVTFIARSGTFTVEELEKAGVKYIIENLTELPNIISVFFKRNDVRHHDV